MIHIYFIRYFIPFSLISMESKSLNIRFLISLQNIFLFKPIFELSQSLPLYKTKLIEKNGRLFPYLPTKITHFDWIIKLFQIIFIQQEIHALLHTQKWDNVWRKKHLISILIFVFVLINEWMLRRRCCHSGGDHRHNYSCTKDYKHRSTATGISNQLGYEDLPIIS